MGIPTITVGGVIFTFNDGDCETVETSLGANIDFDAMPLSTADGALMFDVNGVTKTILVKGNLSNSGTTRLNVGTAITLNDQRKWLEQNLNGNQSGGSWDSNYASTYNGAGWYASVIMFSQIRFIDNEGNPEGLLFEIILLVGSA